MNDRLRTLGRTSSAFALGALVLGALHATVNFWSRTWVLEFQAGPASSLSEKALAIVQSAALESCGFLAVGFVLSLAALGLARWLPRPIADEPEAAYGGALILCSGAFFGWTGLCWLADDALAFLTRPGVLLLDVVGILGLLSGLVFFDLLVRRCPWTPRAAEPSAIASLAGAYLATWVGLHIVQTGDQGWRQPILLIGAAVVYLGAVPLAGLLAWPLAWPLARLHRRLRRGPLLSPRLALLLWVVLIACALTAWNGFQLSPLRGAGEYATLSPRPSGPGPNVVFVTVDTLRADHLGCYGYSRPTSPFLDRIAAEGTLCADATAAASWTKPATGTLLTGLYPSRHGALYHGSRLSLPEGKETLAQAFRERGYVTAGFVSNPNLKKAFAFDQGFDVYFDSPVEDTLTLACIRASGFGQLLTKLLRHQFNWNYENDCKRMNREVLAWLEKNHDQRFFLYVHYIDPHIPYDPPPRYREEFAQDHGLALFNERKRLVGIDLYDGEIRYGDDGLAELVAKLRQLGQWENTLFVFTSDHGEEFFEHGVLGHGFSLYQEVVHVPLVLHGPGVPRGLVVEEPLQLVDLAATVLDLAGAGVKEFGDGNSFRGQLEEHPGAALRPLFLESEFGRTDDDHREFVFSGVRSGPWKLVLTEENAFFPTTDPRNGREALYDLETDPGERKNLFIEQHQQPLIEGLLKRLREHAQFLQEQGFRNIPPVSLTPDVEAELKALGYVSGK